MGVVEAIAEGNVKFTITPKPKRQEHGVKEYVKCFDRVVLYNG